MDRLHLGAVPAPYDRSALRPGIVHLGVGAFQRAHLVPATEAAIVATGDLRWGIVGVSLRSPDTRDALAPQNSLYTLALRDADVAGAPREQLQVLHCLLRVLVAPEDPQAVHEAIAQAETRIVSLTVTEKGYLATTPGSTLDVLARGLALRRARGAGGLTLMSLDNLPSNGHVLHERLLAHVRAGDAALADWIAAHCTFPCSMVDRIVPRTTDADRESISAALGCTDAWPVVGEPFFDWAVEDDFAAGRPAWQHGGARFVADAKPFETLKLRCVNGTHSALAYLGAMAGWSTVDRAVAEPALRGFIEAMLRDEIEPTLPALPGLDLDARRAALLQRFANPALQHRTQQIAMDGSQKLPQRLLGTVRDRLRAGASIECLGLAVAAWIHYQRGVDEAGTRYPIQDPLADAIAACLAEADRAADEVERIVRFCTGTSMFGDDLGHDPRFVQTVARHTAALRERGVLATLEALPAVQ
jgi:fructuronate reductase